MPIPTDTAHIVAVLQAHGVTLPDQELEAVQRQVAANAQMIRALTDTAELVRPETLPALHPVWAPREATVAGAAGASRTHAGPHAAAAGLRLTAPEFPRRYDSPSEAVEAALAQIEAHPGTHVFTAVFAEEARAEAKALEQRVGRGAGNQTGRDQLPLWGTTVSIKDLMRIKGYAMTGGTKALTWPAAGDDAPVVQRLRRAGAVVIGATNLHELALGTLGANPHFGVTANPAAPGRYPGGSSSGSAASVGFGMATFSIGTDTGGSIRIPAACCGVVGFKPSYGLLPTEGVFPLGYSLDHVGPLAKTVTEAAVLMDVLAERPGAFTAELERPLKGLRIGVPRNYFTAAHPGVLAAYEAALQQAQARGAKLVPIELPMLEWAPAVYLGTSGVEAIAIHYHTLVRHRDKLGPDLRIRLTANLFLPAYVRVKAQQLRTLMFSELAEAFRSVDIIAAPTLPITPPPVGTTTIELQGEPMATNWAFLRHTCPFNLTGLPAISIPGGTDADGAPVGLQLVGPYGQDAQVLQAARAMEREVLAGQ